MNIPIEIIGIVLLTLLGAVGYIIKLVFVMQKQVEIISVRLEDYQAKHNAIDNIESQRRLDRDNIYDSKIVRLECEIKELKTNFIQFENKINSHLDKKFNEFKEIIEKKGNCND